eukprot:1956580-Rhodomonas_salina.1
MAKAAAAERSARPAWPKSMHWLKRFVAMPCFPSCSACLAAAARKAPTLVSASSSTARTAAVEGPPRVLSKSRWRLKTALSKCWAPPTGTDSEAANLAA